MKTAGTGIISAGRLWLFQCEYVSFQYRLYI